MSEADTGLTTSDEELIAHARSGDQSAFAELWRRHYRSGFRVARQFTSSIDADDLVSEAYTRIYQRVLAGGGPTGAFRPYLYTTIRNLASSWGAKSRDIQVDDIADYEDPATIEDPVAIALDRTLTARAFRSLPERWQSVLWYTEVEGMDPHEVAPILGMSANGVAALSYRAREGLRKAWLQAHVSGAGVSEACKWTISRLGENARHSLTPREREKVADHLRSCTKCAIVSEEVDEVGSHLAMVLLPILVGGGVGGLLLATLGHASAASAATVAGGVVPAVPASFTVLGASAVFAPAVSSGLAIGGASGVSALVGSLAVVAVIGGSVALGISGTPTHQPQVSASTSSSSASAAGELPRTNSRTDLPNVGDGGSPLALPAPTGTVGTLTTGGGAVVGSVLNGITNSVVSPLLGALAPGSSSSVSGAPVTATLQLAGNGTPGAVVAAQASGVLYATATVDSGGSWSMQVPALPAGTTTIQLYQTLTVLGARLPIEIPLALGTASSGIVVQLLN